VTFAFIFGTLLIFGSILALMVFIPSSLGAYLLFNPYLGIGIFLSFIAGLILISFSSVAIENTPESTEKAKNFRFIRWYIASPLLIIILFKIYGYISLLSSGSDVSHHFDDLEIEFGICAILIFPEIIRFIKSLFRLKL
jgi:hypothetical protein